MVRWKKMTRVVYQLYSSVQTGGKLIFSKQYLLYTNIGLSVGISAVGDVLEQSYQHSKNGSFSRASWDCTRTGKMAATGLVVAPFIHYWYQQLDVIFPGRCWKVLFKKVSLDFIICSPVCVLLFLMTTGLLDRQGWSSFKEELQKTGTTMCLTDLLVWTPLQIFNFYFLPTRYRILFDNIVSLAMDTFYSHLRFGENSSYQLHVKEVAE
ncbi:unnamed protein product [Candidula unifasciata]|uniref:Mpv17-like protein 2 n=1 Tax=Candidula unifasciata TaxID=100452 RepID=A0A8S3YUB8_9EUPU|nr:unnamed protein product [Candidula unifasciata]